MMEYEIRILSRQWLSTRTFEIRFSRPSGFRFFAGQKIRFLEDGRERDYSLINGPDDPLLALCVRFIRKGRFTPILAQARAGRSFRVTAPFGFFTRKSSERQAVLVATGTGIAPFVAFVRSGFRGFILLHGVPTAQELYYAELFSSAARLYAPCLSAQPATAVRVQWPGAFHGRVSRYLETVLPGGGYDFYLCGSGDMIRDVTAIVDRRFDGSRIYTETFF